MRFTPVRRAFSGLDWRRGQPVFVRRASDLARPARRTYFDFSAFLSSANVSVFTTSAFVSQPLRATPAPRRR